jgi:DNA (cytosine-5)-methyltransferase 1
MARKHETKNTVVSLFSGIGGIEVGLHRAGFSTELFCENDPYAQAVLRKNFAGITIAPDVTTLKNIPRCHVMTAGFPCQDLSQAGRKVGIGGQNSGLVEHIFNLLRLDKLEPDGWLLIENVAYMLRLDQGRAMAYLVKEVESAGFRWAYRVIDARAFGLPQRRPRVVFLASRVSDPRGPLLADSVMVPKMDGRPSDVDPECIYGFYWTEGSRGVGWAKEAVPPIKGGSGIGIPSPPAIWFPLADYVGLPDIRDLERLQGFPERWTEAAVSVDKKGMRVRWRLVGNAVSTRMSEWLGHRLRKSASYDQSTDVEVATPSWPKAAWGEDGRVYSANVTTWPVRNSHEDISDFLRYDTRPLSVRATRGFLKRTSVCTNVNYNDGFIRSLEEHARKQESAILRVEGVRK